MQPCSVMKTLRRCKSIGEADNIVLIDVDNDSFNNVIVIDVPESLKKKLRGSSGLRKDNKCPLRTYICIDDDKTSESHSGASVVGDGKFNSGASSSKRHSPASNRTHYPAGNNHFHFSSGNVSPVKLSKCKRTYSGKASSNCYGFSINSDSDSSDNDGPDCEFMEDSSGQLREQWEKAFLKKKSDIRNDRSSGRDQVYSRSTDGRHQGGGSRFSTCDCENVEADNKTEKCHDAAVSSDPRNVSYMEEYQAPTTRAEGKVGDTAGDHMTSPFANTYPNSKQKAQIHDKSSDIHVQGDSLMDDISCCNSQLQTHKDNMHGASDFCNDEPQCLDKFPLFPNNQWDNGKVNSQAGTISLDSDLSGHANVFHSEASLSFDKAPSCQGQDTCDNKVCHDQFVCEDEVDKHELAGYEDLDGEKACLESLFNSSKEVERNGLSHAPDDDDLDVETNIINEREKLKETDEYKRGLEEEWSSRQIALKMQAEEAQQLRRLNKKRKAENLRLLDMERRQKQRVEEIRENQKKDEQQMNLKELHRTEVRKELVELELKCHDMTSLLRGLGIQVGGGAHPSPHEVRAAYKRALLIFHPDRASGSDVRQQVEAEEKFKLISRMKDKFLPT